jgi:hypothetical protein
MSRLGVRHVPPPPGTPVSNRQTGDDGYPTNLREFRSGRRLRTRAIVARHTVHTRRRNGTYAFLRRAEIILSAHQPEALLEVTAALYTL